VDFLVATDKDTNNPFLGPFSLRRAINYTNAQNTADQQRITSTVGLAGATFWLNDQLPAIKKNIFIDGKGRGQTIERDGTKGNFRLLRVETGGTLKVAHLSLENGFTDQNLGGGLGGGGAIWSQGTLFADDCLFYGNSVSSTVQFGAGGAIWASGQKNGAGVV